MTVTNNWHNINIIRCYSHWNYEYKIFHLCVHSTRIIDTNILGAILLPYWIFESSTATLNLKLSWDRYHWRLHMKMNPIKFEPKFETVCVKSILKIIYINIWKFNFVWWFFRSVHCIYILKNVFNII